MYHSYFGLKEQVFSIAVDPHYLYMSSQHREALAHLLYGVSSGGFVLLTGEVGTGKTTIVRCLLEQLPEGTDLAIVLNPVASAPELLADICDELGIARDPNESSIKALTDKLYVYLLANHTKGRNTVLLIDEAQLLRVSTLEQIRLLTNLETSTRKLLQIILVGQPELNRLLAKPGLRQLSQRITARYHLRALTLDETSAYIAHRLHVAGMKQSDQPFPAAVIARIHGTSRGIPRLINILCDRMLLGAYSQDKTRIDDSICRQARREVLGEEVPAAPARRSIASALQLSGLAVTLVVVALTAWQFLPFLMAPESTPAAAEPAEALSTSPVPATIAPVRVTNSFSSYAHPAEDGALRELFAALDIAADQSSCDAIAAIGYQCQRSRLDTWNQLRDLNRPAVLRLITPAKIETFAALVGLDDAMASLSVAGNLHRMALSELGPLWTGEVIYVWHKPEAFTDVVAYGAEGPMVDWIAAQFAQLDEQSKPLATTHFNKALAERVKIFQRNHQLRDDGVFGLRTLMALNEQLGLDKTLQDLNPLLSAER
jgi:general secretion pathway protein A